MGRCVLVVGCGHLGIRHIQGLSRSSHRLIVHVHDNSLKALAKAEEFLSNNLKKQGNIEIHYWENFSLLIKAVARFELVIVSTTAVKRDGLLNKLFKNLSSTFWLIEKPICQSNYELDRILSMAPVEGIWVNYPRRLYKWFREIKSNIPVDSSLSVTVSGKELGLACNGSHYIDLVNWWTGEIPLSVNIKNLNKEWVAAKRKNFFEVEGIIEIHFSEGSTLNMISNPRVNKECINVSNQELNWGVCVEESVGKARFSNGVIVSGSNTYQSDLTGIFFDELIFTGSCGLTTLTTAAQCYEKFLLALNSHWQSSPQSVVSESAYFT